VTDAAVGLWRTLGWDAAPQPPSGCHRLVVTIGHGGRPEGAGGQATQAPLTSVRAGSVPQGSGTGVSGRQWTPAVQRNRRSLPFRLTQLG
jgi:hypothetical protein